MGDDYTLGELIDILRNMFDGGICVDVPDRWCDSVTNCYECKRALADAIERRISEQYVRLPVDADGVPIHIGDQMDVGKVARIVLTDEQWEPYVYTYDAYPCILSEHFCNEISHHHAPTVEDVLTEFAAKLIERGELTNGGATTIAEYAAKLRLAESEG